MKEVAAFLGLPWGWEDYDGGAGDCCGFDSILGFDGDFCLGGWVVDSIFGFDWDFYFGG